MKYRITRMKNGETLVVAEGGRPAQRYASVVFQNTWKPSDAVRHVARYVEAVREATRQAKSVQVNASVSDDS